MRCLEGRSSYGVVVLLSSASGDGAARAWCVFVSALELSGIGWLIKRWGGRSRGSR